MEERIKQVNFSSCGKWLALFGDTTSDIFFWNLNTRQLEYILVGHKKPLIDIFFAPTKNQLISYGTDLTIRYWNLNTENLRNYEFVNYRRQSSSITCSADGLWIGSHEDNTIQLRETLSGKLIETTEALGADISTIMFNPKKNEEVIYRNIENSIYTINMLSKEKQLCPQIFQEKSLGQFTLNTTGEKIVIYNYYGSKPPCFGLLESHFNQQNIFEDQEGIISFAFHPNEKRVAMGRTVDGVYLKHLTSDNTLKTINVLCTHGQIKDLSFSSKRAISCRKR